MNSPDAPGFFDHVPRTPGGHFVINLYAAIFRLLNQSRLFAEAGQHTLERLFDNYPFLGEYFNEMRQHMPEDLTWEDAAAWWQDQVTSWERGCSVHLPLRALAEQAALGFQSRLAIMIVGLVEEDSRFGTLIAELQAPLTHRRPTLELTGQMLLGAAAVGESDPWTICRPLLAAGLVEVQNRPAPRSEWLLRVPPLLWDAMRGQLDDPPAAWCRVQRAVDQDALDQLVFDAATLERLAQVPPLLAAGRARVLLLRGLPGVDAVRVAGSVAAALGHGLLELEGTALDQPEVAALVGPLCALADLVPCIAFDLAPGETARLPPLIGYAGPVIVRLGPEGGLDSALAESALTLNLPALTPALRERLWRRLLAPDDAAELATIVDGFRLGGAYIRKVAQAAQAQAALDSRTQVRSADVRRAARTLNRQLLDTLATPMPAEGSWQDVVAVQGTRDKLLELEQRCRHRERLLEMLGPAFGRHGNRGVRALFTGASGTGKTLAARVLAAVLGRRSGAAAGRADEDEGMDLYRVDLASVVNKYIGETEKNLHQVLSRAEALDVMLLLDEGDALLGARTDVKSANDRYANLETNFLLQRLENYQGIVIVTTNLGENIDQAFQRRMDVVVPFFPPQPEERLRILALHLPAQHRVSPALCERIALRCPLTGSQLRNATLHATLLALEDGGVMHERHLDAGVRSEYRKAGGLCPLDFRSGPREAGAGVDAFLSAFTRG